MWTHGEDIKVGAEEKCTTGHVPAMKLREDEGLTGPGAGSGEGRVLSIHG